MLRLVGLVYVKPQLFVIGFLGRPICHKSEVPHPRNCSAMYATSMIVRLALGLPDGRTQDVLG